MRHGEPCFFWTSNDSRGMSILVFTLESNGEVQWCFPITPWTARCSLLGTMPGAIPVFSHNRTYVWFVPFFMYALLEQLQILCIFITPDYLDILSPSKLKHYNETFYHTWKLSFPRLRWRVLAQITMLFLRGYSHACTMFLYSHSKHALYPDEGMAWNSLVKMQYWEKFWAPKRNCWKRTSN